jgi:hypothetical protein
MSYTHNDDKPEALLVNYGTVRGAELKEIYRVLEKQGDVPESALAKRFARPESNTSDRDTDHLDECLKFLSALDMLTSSAQKVVQLRNETVYPGLSFEGRLLHHIRQQSGKQYHLAYLFDVLAAQDRRRIGREPFLTEVKQDEGRKFGLQWNTTKLNMWGNLADTLGALSYVDNSEIVTSPTRALLYDLLSWYSDNGDDPEQFLGAMDWIHEEILPVYASQPGTPRVAVGVADVLRNMEAEGVLSFRSMSDTQRVVKLPKRTGSETEPVASFTIDDEAGAVPYTFPLDRQTTEVVA